MNYEYKVKISGDTSDLEKVLKEANGSLSKLADNEVLIKFGYDENKKELNKLIQDINKISPELSVQFQYDINKKALAEAEKKLSDMQLNSGADALLKKLNDAYNEYNKLSSNSTNIKNLEKQRDLMISISKSILDLNADDKISNNIFDLLLKFEKDMGDDLYDKIPKFEIISEEDIARQKNLIQEIQEELSRLNPNVKVDFEIEAKIDEEIKSVESEIDGLKSKLKSLDFSHISEIGNIENLINKEYAGSKNEERLKALVFRLNELGGSIDKIQTKPSNKKGIRDIVGDETDLNIISNITNQISDLENKLSELNSKKNNHIFNLDNVTQESGNNVPINIVPEINAEEFISNIKSELSGKEVGINVYPGNIPEFINTINEQVKSEPVEVNIKPVEINKDDIGNAFNNESQTVDSMVSNEKQALGELSEFILSTVIPAIDAKTQAFTQEKLAVDTAVQSELKRLEELKDVLKNISDLIDGIDFSKLGKDLDTSKFKSLKNAFNIDDNKIANKFLQIHDYIELFVNEVNKLDFNKSGIIDQLNEILTKGEELKNLASIIKSSQKDIKKAKESTSQKPKVDPDIKSYNKEVKKFSNLSDRTEEYQEHLKYIKSLIQAINDEQLKPIEEQDVELIKNTKQNISSMLDDLKTNGKNFKIADELNKIKLSNKITQWLERNDGASKKTKQSLNELIEKVEQVGNMQDLKNLNKDFLKITQSARLAGEEVKSFATGFKGQIRHQFEQQLARYFSLQDIIRYIREISSTVVELDSNLTELRKVSNATEDRLVQSFEHSTETAKELGSTISDVIKVTSDWARLGYNVDEAEELARVTTLFKTVGDNMSAEDASSYLVSSLQGFQKGADEAIDIVDKYNEVANNFAIDTAGIGEALQRSAASFNAARTDIDKSIALVTATNEVVQNPESVGTLWKTLSARIRGAKTELEDMGEDTDDLVESTSKLRDMVKGMTGFDIMEDEDTFKDIYDIILGIGKEWDKLTDIEQASLGEALAGKRNANALYAVLGNLDTLQDAYKTAQEAAGSAEKEQENYAKSIQYSLDVFKASVQELAADFLKSDFLKGAVDFGTKIVNILDEIIKKTGMLGPILAGLGGYLGFKNFGGRKCTVSNKIAEPYKCYASRDVISYMAA